jgi:hypothetical protein
LNGLFNLIKQFSSYFGVALRMSGAIIIADATKQIAITR